MPVISREELSLPIYPRGPRPRPIEYYVNENGCHICTSHCPRMRRGQQIGYPTISILGTDHSINHILYEWKNGPLPNGLILRHTCDEPMCINPDHNIPGTPLDNSRDMVERGRSAIGEKNANSCLSEADVELIKASISIPSRHLARLYGVAHGTILAIWNGEIWSHVGPPKVANPRDGARKLTREQVLQIKRRPDAEVCELAKANGVTNAAIYDIRHGRTWSWLETEDDQA